MKPLTNIEIWIGSTEIGFLLALGVAVAPMPWVVMPIPFATPALASILLIVRWRRTERRTYSHILVDQFLYWMSVLAGVLFFLGSIEKDGLQELSIALTAFALWTLIGWIIQFFVIRRRQDVSRSSGKATSLHRRASLTAKLSP